MAVYSAFRTASHDDSFVSSIANMTCRIGPPLPIQYAFSNVEISSVDNFGEGWPGHRRYPDRGWMMCKTWADDPVGKARTKDLSDLWCMSLILPRERRLADAHTWD